MGISNTANPLPKPNWNLAHDSFSFEHVTLREVTDLIEGIDVYKDSCIEGISTFILKDGFGILTYQMHYPFNISLRRVYSPENGPRDILISYLKAVI